MNLVKLLERNKGEEDYSAFGWPSMRWFWGIRDHCRNNKRGWFSVLIFITLLAGVVALILYVYKSVPVLKFEVDSLNMKLSYTDKRVITDFDVTLTINNTAGDLLYFDSTLVSLEYRHSGDGFGFLSSTTLEPFVQAQGIGQLKFHMKINEDDARVENKTVDSISRDLWDKNVLHFGLKAQGRYNNLISVGIKECSIKVICNDINLIYLSESGSGSMIAAPLSCKCNSACFYVRNTDKNMHASI